MAHCWRSSLRNELLAAVDAYVAPASAVLPHDVKGQRSDISWSDDVPDGQHHAQPGEQLTPECANLAKPAQNQARENAHQRSQVAKIFGYVIMRAIVTQPHVRDPQRL